MISNDNNEVMNDDDNLQKLDDALLIDVEFECNDQE
jgi:hypothetical protein